MIVGDYLKASVLLVALAAATGVVASISLGKIDRIRAENSAEPVEFVSMKDRERQLKCMTENIYYEAGQEPVEGKIAVAQVVMNRTESNRFPSDPCRVIYQKNVFYEKVVCQFSWYCDKSVKRRPVNQARWNESEEVAKSVLLEGMRLPSLEKAMYYHATYVNPGWKNPRITKIGQHVFYREI